jgi:hypothetical protein
LTLSRPDPPGKSCRYGALFFVAVGASIGDKKIKANDEERKRSRRKNLRIKHLKLCAPERRKILSLCREQKVPVEQAERLCSRVENEYQWFSDILPLRDTKKYKSNPKKVRITIDRFQNSLRTLQNHPEAMSEILRAYSKSYVCPCEWESSPQSINPILLEQSSSTHLYRPANGNAELASLVNPDEFLFRLDKACEKFWEQDQPMKNVGQKRHDPRERFFISRMVSHFVNCTGKPAELSTKGGNLKPDKFFSDFVQQVFRNQFEDKSYEVSKKTIMNALKFRSKCGKPNFPPG